MDRVSEVAAGTDYDHYARRLDGSMIPQTSSPEAVARLLRLLAVPVGGRVLEIGTGSGYSTALLARLAGPTGHVTSIDIDSSLTRRAAVMLAEASCRNIAIHQADGIDGYPADAPYSHVIVWATAEAIPFSWAQQAVPGAVIVAPVELAPIPSSSVTVRARVQGPTDITAETFSPGSFVPLVPQVLTDWAIPPRHVDYVNVAAGAAPAWISGAWLRGAARGQAAWILKQMQAANPTPGTLAVDEDADSFVRFLFTTQSVYITEARFGHGGHWTGLASEAEFALVRHPDVDCRDALWVAHGGQLAIELEDTISGWRASGRPDVTDLQPTVTRTDAGWLVRPAVAETPALPLRA